MGVRLTLKRGRGLDCNTTSIKFKNPSHIILPPPAPPWLAYPTTNHVLFARLVVEGRIILFDVSQSDVRGLATSQQTVSSLPKAASSHCDPEPRSA